MQKNRFQLQPKLIEQTLGQLHERIEERFPGSGLGKVCASLREISADAERRSNWLGRPLYWLRILTLLMIAVIIAALVGQFSLMQWTENDSLDWTELIQVMEAAINELFLIMAAIFFMVTLENRYKRRKGLKAIHELRSIAHVIDMHQLTKDPASVLGAGRTASSPERDLSPADLMRYLDYCTEMLSLTGKLAALCMQSVRDEVVIHTVNEIEGLTTNLSSKIWQKIMIIRSEIDLPVPQH